MNLPVMRDEFETVKQLLESAATYAESANRQADRNANAISRLEMQGSEIKESQKKTDQNLQQLAENQKKTDQQLQQLAESQKKTDQQLQQLTQRTDQPLQQLSQRLDSFIFESQRIIADNKQKINRLDAIIDRYDGVLAYLMRKDHPEMD